MFLKKTHIQNYSLFIKKIINNMSYIRENFDNRKNITLLYFYIGNHGLLNNSEDRFESLNLE